MVAMSALHMYTKLATGNVVVHACINLKVETASPPEKLFDYKPGWQSVGLVLHEIVV
jgi:hypothetical protein